MILSIACALYNGETYILEQLESLQAQTRQADEVILFDDHSTDNTYELVKQYIHDHNQTNWHLFQQPVNKGYIKNFHDALQACHGDIIFLCDQDDIWDHKKLEIYVDYFQTHPTIACLNSAYYIKHMGQTETNLSTQALTEANLTFQSILYHNIAMGCTMAIKKDLVSLYLKNTSCIAPHDWELNTLAASRNSLAYLDQPLITYRIHDDNTTGIDTMNGQKKITESSREKNATTIYALSQGLSTYSFHSEQSTFLQSYQNFARLRYELLHNKKISNWFRLMKYHKIYTSMLSWKGILVDLLYACTKK